MKAAMSAWIGPDASVPSKNTFISEDLRKPDGLSDEEWKMICEMRMKQELELMGVNTGSDPEVWGCFKACQHKLSKTNMTLDFIIKHHCQRYMTQEQMTYQKHSKIHHITFLFVNCSILETKQWVGRSRMKIKDPKLNLDTNVNIDILSSDAKTATWKNSKEFLSSLMVNASEDKRDKLPNIVIMCTHTARTFKDQKVLFETFSNWKNRSSLNFMFNYVFDEVDGSRCITPVKKLLKLMKDMNVPNLGDILFVTATPFDTFWNMLDTVDIKDKLKSIDSELDIDESEINDAEEDYRNYLGHVIDIFNSSNKNPRFYLEEYLRKNPDILDSNEPKIFFAPAEKTIKSHIHLLQSSIFDGWWKMILNGKHKGFLPPDETDLNNIITKEEFDQTYNVSGNDGIRDTLRKWKELYPNDNLVISGGDLLERGLTFCTDGFSFTHFFLSPYHLSNINKLIQTIGRACGNKNYINKMNIICPEEIDKIARNYFSEMSTLNKSQIEIFEREHFDEIANGTKERNDKNDYEEYILHYRVFSDIHTAKQYSSYLKHIDGSRVTFKNKHYITSTNGEKFYTDSLSQQGKNEPRNRDDAIKRLRSNLYRSHNLGEKIAKTVSIFYYNKCPFNIGDNIYVGGDSSTLQIIIPIPFQKEEDETGLPTYILQLDESFNIQEDQKHTIISKREI